MVITDFLPDVLTLILKKEKNLLIDEPEWTQKLTLRRMKYGMKLMNE
jgi:hypothetical protein